MLPLTIWQRQVRMALTYFIRYKIGNSRDPDVGIRVLQVGIKSASVPERTEGLVLLCMPTLPYTCRCDGAQGKYIASKEKGHQSDSFK